MASRNRVKLDPASEEKLANMLDFYSVLPEHVALLQEMETRLMASFEDLTNAVKRNSDVVKSAVTLINGLAGRVQACGADPERLAELINDLNKETGELADAVAANTIAEPPTPSGIPTPAEPEVPAESPAPAGPPLSEPGEPDAGPSGPSEPST